MEPHFERGLERGRGESPERERNGGKEFNGTFYVAAKIQMRLWATRVGVVVVGF